MVKPVEGMRIIATVRFPRGEGRRECLVTKVTQLRRFSGQGTTFLSVADEPMERVIGRYRTNRGAWSTMERVLLRPFERAGS